MIRLPRSLFLLFLASLVAGCSGSGNEPPTVASVEVSPNTSTLVSAGQTVQFSAQAKDANGNPMSSTGVTWSSTATGVATVSGGLATAVGDGTTTIRASIDGVTGAATLRVELAAAALEKVGGDNQTASVLTRAPEDPTVRLVDSGGAPISGRLVTFQVLTGGGIVAPQTRVTSLDGTASTAWTLGEATGTQTLQATAEGFTATFTATGETGQLAVRTLTLDDARVSLSYGEQLEALGGQAPYTWSITSGSLPSGLSLGLTGALSGSPGGTGTSQFTVQVQDALGATANLGLSLRVCEAPLSLTVGQVYEAGPATSSGCVPMLPSGGNGDRYRVALVRTASSPNLQPGTAGYAIPATVEFKRIGGLNDLASVAPVALQDATSRRPFMADLPPRLRRDLEIAQKTEAMHHKLLMEAEELYRRFGAPTLRSLPVSTLPFMAETALADPPDRITIKPYDADQGCSAPAASPAKLLGFSDRIAVYQDSAQAAGSGDVDTAAVQETLDYFDDYGQQTITDYYGDVGDRNGDGRVVVVVSPAVNEGVAAFVWPGDFFDPAQCEASNNMELIYWGKFMFDRIADGDYSALPVLVHEMKHVSSIGRRLVNGNFHPSWVEEGSAEIAAETSSRFAMDAVGDVGKGEILTRSAFPPTGVASPARYGVILRLFRITISYSGTINSLTSNPPENSDHTFYGTSWHFQRFLGDAYGNAAGLQDGAFFKALNDENAQTGVEGFEAATGQSFEALMKEYAAAMMLNGMGTPAPARGFTTYDFTTATKIFREEFQPPGSYPWPSTGASPVDFQSRTYPGSLAPGGVRIFDLQSNGTADGLEVRPSVTGGTAELLIVRIN